MSNPFANSDAEIIDVPPPKRRRWRRYLLAGILLFFLAFSRILAVYVSALWFGSIG